MGIYQPQPTIYVYKICFLHWVRRMHLNVHTYLSCYLKCICSLILEHLKKMFSLLRNTCCWRQENKITIQWKKIVNKYIYIQYIYGNVFALFILLKTFYKPQTNITTLTKNNVNLYLEGTGILPPKLVLNKAPIGVCRSDDLTGNVRLLTSVVLKVLTKCFITEKIKAISVRTALSDQSFTKERYQSCDT